jgi:hypothetical protein
MSASLDDLDALVGEWSMVTSFAEDAAHAPRARTTFEWLPGRRFLVQRWEVDHPAAPDGIAIIGRDPESGGLRQHYFDSRGVVRVYEMTFADDVWTLERSAAAPDFSQRFTGRLDEGGNTLVGRWQHSSDGSNWEDDFGITYTRLR